MVANPVKVRTLLEAVREQPRNGPRLVAFYAFLYFAGLRPGDAAALATRHLALPASGWGVLHLDGAKHASKDWTDTSGNRDERQLKQRARGDVRTVPCPTELTQPLHDHVREFGTGPEGRLFRGDRNRTELPRGHWVPPAGFEPAPPPPEGGALSPELRGLGDHERVAGRPGRPATGFPPPPTVHTLRPALDRSDSVIAVTKSSRRHGVMPTSAPDGKDVATEHAGQGEARCVDAGLPEPLSLSC